METGRLPLFLNEADLATHLGIPLEKWKTLARSYEQAGMPRPDAICGLRYRPAVEEFFARRNRLPDHLIGEPSDIPPVVENLDAFNRRPGRPKKPSAPKTK